MAEAEAALKAVAEKAAADEKAFAEKEAAEKAAAEKAAADKATAIEHYPVGSVVDLIYDGKPRRVLVKTHLNFMGEFGIEVQELDMGGRRTSFWPLRLCEPA